jgi:hypothetical protein
MPGIPLAARQHHPEEKGIAGIVRRELHFDQQMVDPVPFLQHLKVLVQVLAAWDVVIEVFKLNGPFADVVLDTFELVQLSIGMIFYYSTEVFEL